MRCVARNYNLVFPMCQANVVLGCIKKLIYREFKIIVCLQDKAKKKKKINTAWSWRGLFINKVQSGL